MLLCELYKPFVKRQMAAHQARIPTVEEQVAEAAWSVAEGAVAPRFDNPRATELVLVLG